MRFTIASIALAAGTASAAAQYGYGYEAPANTTSAVETPAYPASSDVYVTKTVSCTFDDINDFVSCSC
jgi:hypothetical protein